MGWVRFDSTGKGLYDRFGACHATQKLPGLKPERETTESAAQPAPIDDNGVFGTKSSQNLGLESCPHLFRLCNHLAKGPFLAPDRDSFLYSSFSSSRFFPTGRMPWMMESSTYVLIHFRWPKTFFDIELYLNSLAALPTILSRLVTENRPRDGSKWRPCFITHYGQIMVLTRLTKCIFLFFCVHIICLTDMSLFKFINLSDQHLYAKRRESIIGVRDQFDIVQILTWNDRDESDYNYIGPIKGADWQVLIIHDFSSFFTHCEIVWQDLTQYYATAFKTGQYPTIEEDIIVMWSRPHSTSASAPIQSRSLRIFSWYVAFSLPSLSVYWCSTFYITFFSSKIPGPLYWPPSSPSNVTLSTSPTTSQTFLLPAGLSKLSLSIFSWSAGTLKEDLLRGIYAYSVQCVLLKIYMIVQCSSQEVKDFEKLSAIQQRAPSDYPRERCHRSSTIRHRENGNVLNFRAIFNWYNASRCSGTCFIPHTRICDSNSICSSRSRECSMSNVTHGVLHRTRR